MIDYAPIAVPVPLNLILPTSGSDLLALIHLHACGHIGWSQSNATYCELRSTTQSPIILRLDCWAWCYGLQALQCRKALLQIATQLSWKWLLRSWFNCIAVVDVSMKRNFASLHVARPWHAVFQVRNILFGNSCPSRSWSVSSLAGVARNNAPDCQLYPLQTGRA